MRRTLAVVLAGLALTGCGTPGAGLRVEGRAEDVRASPPPVADGSPTVDEVRVLRDDPGVGHRVKAAVARPCSNGAFRGWYPVYTRYATVGGAGTVVLMDVAGCEDHTACGGTLGAFVYRLDEGRPERVFGTEEAGSRVTADGTGLRLERPVFNPGDDEPCPSTTHATPLRWDGVRFAEAGR
ncbi:hypothetical protein LUW76_23740 [Actinomadura madurae]|uniref:hypothetical protein n=1 Tax=Actinomadura madurae TaxID=1993 RepID=UPI0020264882|nr:hypothetical protein [Actinomadura madurae]URM97120.1 hypothetical protein LUW76_23740 [Actinomadura madurae]